MVNGYSNGEGGGGGGEREIVLTPRGWVTQLRQQPVLATRITNGLHHIGSGKLGDGSLSIHPHNGYIC